MTESTLERRIGLFCKAHGLLYYKFSSPGRRGVPDRMIVGPGQKVMFLEIKAPGKKPTKLQLHEIAKLKENGFVAEWVDNLFDALELIHQTMLKN